MSKKMEHDQKKIEMILDVICEYFRIQPTDLIHGGQGPDITFVRKIASYIFTVRYQQRPSLIHRMLGFNGSPMIAYYRKAIDAFLREENGIGNITSLTETLCAKIDARLDSQYSHQRPKCALDMTASVIPPALPANHLLGIAIRECAPIVRQSPTMATGMTRILDVCQRIAIFIAWNDQKKKVRSIASELSITENEVISAIGFVHCFGNDGLRNEIETMLTKVRKKVIPTL